MNKIIIIIVLAIISVGSLGYMVFTSPNFGAIGKDKAKAITEKFINEELLEIGETIVVGEITEEGDLYKISINLSDGREVFSYLTKDGKFFFPEKIEITGVIVDEEPEISENNNNNNNNQNQMELKTEILVEGSGDQVVKTGDSVSVDYTGTLEDGTEFDSSIGREPFVFTVGQGQVITGWDQGLIGMKIGEERKLTIPSELGYGSTAVGPIPPNSTLIFSIKLISID
jgi:hypothetical protein